MPSQRQIELAKHRRQLAWLLFAVNEPERLAEDPWWVDSSLADELESTRGDLQVAPVMTNHSTRRPAYSPLPTGGWESPTPPPPSLSPAPAAAIAAEDIIEISSDDDDNDHFDDDDDDSSNSSSTSDDSDFPPPLTPAPAPAPSTSPPSSPPRGQKSIPDDVWALVSAIKSHPTGRSGLPRRQQLGSDTQLAGEIDRTGVLRVEKRGGRLRKYAGDKRLFSESMWRYLLEE